MKLRTVALVVIVLLSCALVNGESSLTIKKIKREVYLQTQNVAIVDKYTFENTGSSPVDTVIVCSLKDHADHLALQQVTRGEAVPLQAKPSAAASENITCLDVALEEPIAPGQTRELESSAIYTHLLTPYPSSITQNEAQRVVFLGSANVPSPYVVETQTSTYKLPGRSVESYTQVKPASFTKDQVKFGPYKNAPPLKATPIRLHFESNTPFAVVTSLEREIEISHWGNIYVEERYTLTHAGAKLKGTWSRLDFQLNAGEFGKSAFRQMAAVLPPQAHTLYFRDEIGNVSTSLVRRSLNKVDVLLEPRYPLFGGWKVNFVFGYSLPLKGFVEKTTDGTHRFTYTLGPALQNVVVDDLVVKVVLPEGSTDHKKELPFRLDMVTEETKYTYLDTVGRPTVILHKKNVVDQHNQPFVITYRPTFSPLREPMIIVAVFAALFAAAIVYVRSDFSLSRAPRVQAR